MDLPLVSIVVINHNYEAFLATAIDSALAQSHGNIEVIVVDDGSADGSGAIIAGYGGRIRAVMQVNGGHSSAVNAGFAQASGAYVLFLDADDLLLESCMARALAAIRPGDAELARNPRARSATLRWAIRSDAPARDARELAA